MSNSKSFSYQPLQVKQWRAITYDYLGLATNSDISRLYCLTDFQVAWLLSNVPYYNWKPRWENSEHTQVELNDEMANLEYALMSCLQLQPASLDYLYDRAMVEDLAIYDSAYGGGGIPELNENTPTDFYNGDDSIIRREALCTACNIYVRSYINNWIAKAQLTLGITIVASVVVSISLVGGVIAGTLLAGLALITQTALLAMQDNNAIDNVVCCMYNGLLSQTVTQDNWDESLDSCGFDVGSNEAIIRDIVASDITQFDNWLTFLNSLGDAFVLADNGVTSCPCELGGTYIITFDDLSTDNWSISAFCEPTVTVLTTWILQYSGFGNPADSCKTAFIDTGTYEGLQVLVRVDLTVPTTIKSVGADYWYTDTGASNVLARQITLYDSDDNVLESWSTSANDAPKTSWETMTNNQASDVTDVSYIVVGISRVGADRTYATTHGFIDNIVIEF